MVVSRKNLAGLPPRTEKGFSFPSHTQVARRSRLTFLLLFVATLLLTPLLILAGANQGYGQILAAIVALLALALVPWRPVFGLYLILTCAVVIEQEPLIASPIGTDHLNIFFWPAKFQGLPERPIGFFILAVLFVVIFAGLLFRRRPLFGGPLYYPFVVFLACIAMGALHGMTSGGDFRIIVLEVRPFWYLFITYILAFNIVSDVKHVRNIIWITILGSAIKGVQGVFIVYHYLGGQISGHNEIMAHEQSFFFVLVLLLLVMLFLFRFQRGLFIAILVSLPCLMLALVANNRRADYVALFIGIGVVWVMAILLKPESRRWLVPVLMVCVIFGTVYVVAFQHSSSAFATPARAVISVFIPNAADERDAASNAYRKIENYDLKYTAAQSPILGYGFGKPFLQPIVLPNVVELDPYYLYIPHNNILWVWMRLGPVGFGALWYLVGAIIISGCIIARRLKNPELRFFAVFAVAVMVMEVILAYSDYQFFFYRNMIFCGIVIGVLLKLPAIERAANGEPATPIIDLARDDTQAEVSPRRRPRAFVPRVLTAPVPAASMQGLGTEARGRRTRWQET